MKPLYDTFSVIKQGFLKCLLYEHFVAYILCLTSRTAMMTSSRIPEEEGRYCARNLCVFTRVQKGTPGLMHKWCVLQRVSLGALSDVAAVLGIRQSLVLSTNLSWETHCGNRQFSEQVEESNKKHSLQNAIKIQMASVHSIS